jgi:hypothetical protein
MKKYSLTNEFHGTKAIVNVELSQITYFADLSVQIVLTKSQYKRAAKKLCGIKECSCDNLNNFTVIDEDDSRITIEGKSSELKEA